MRIVHSFVSEKCGDDMFYVHMCYFILSCLYAKKSGFEIALHCDNKTKDVLQIAPYDEIITDLQDLEWPAKRLFAWGKFEAMKNESLECIHTDGDVFLKQSWLKDLLEFKEYDCIVQNVEKIRGPWGYLWPESTDAFKHCTYPIWAKKDCLEMYNCGIIGFNNQELKDEYYKTYWDMVDQYKIKGIDMHSVPDLIIEQQFLKDLTDYKKYKVKTLLDFDDLSEADKIGYQHVLGGSKKPNLDKVLTLIERYDINIYNKIKYEIFR